MFMVAYWLVAVMYHSLLVGDLVCGSAGDWLDHHISGVSFTYLSLNSRVLQRH